MYFDDLTTDLKSNVKLLADDTSFFFQKIVISWELQIHRTVLLTNGPTVAFNLGPTKQTHEVRLCRKHHSLKNPNLKFNKLKLMFEKKKTQKYSGLKLNKERNIRM